jgi:predicted ATPase
MTSPNSRLDRLEHSGLIHQIQAWPESEYQFRRTLVQVAAYGTLLMDERQSAHQATAEALERLYRDRLDEIVSILGRHFALAQLLKVLSKEKDAGIIIL